MKNILRFVRNGLRQFELSTYLRHSRIALLFCSFMLMILFCFLLINGCKKSPSDNPILDENKAIHSAAVAGYQALGAGTSFPFEALKLSSPTGSAIHDLSDEKSLLYSLIGPTIFKHNSLISDPLTYQGYLNLYFSSSTTGNVGTLSYYSDAEGTQSAGSMTLTLPANITNLSDPTSYLTFPANIKVAVNITEGNLPCKGNISIGYTDESGANSMTGTLTLSRVDVVLTFNLTLDKQMNTSGSITITENGTTLEMTNVKGNVTGLSYDVKISPSGWTGTGTLDLLSNSIKVKINTKTGKSIVESDNHGNLNLDYADGTHEIVFNAMAAELTGDTPATTTSYNAPLIYVSDQRTITAINNKGQSVGYLGIYKRIPVYWATPTARPDTLHVPTGYDLVTPYNLVTPESINDNGQIVGWGNDPNSGQSVALYWSSPTALPLVLAVPSDAYNSDAYSINNNGQIVGAANNWTDAVYWDSPNDAMPQVLQPLAGAYGGAFFIAPKGQIIGRMDVLEAEPFWASPKDPPVRLSFLSGDSYANAMSVNASGVIVGYSGGGDQRPVTWAGATEAAKELPLLSGSVSGYAASINTAGVIVGSSSSSIYGDGVIWQTNGQVQNLNTLIPSGNSYTLGGASLITDQGWILGTADNDNPSLIGQYLLIPK